MTHRGLDEVVLVQFGAQIKNYTKGEVIFNEDALPRYFFQIKTGCVKMVSHGEEGKSYTQGIFSEAQCFGEPPLVIHATYPASAIAVTDAQIYRLSADNFERMLMENSAMCRQLNQLLACRAYAKAKTNSMLTGQSPEYKIQFILEDFKKKLEPRRENKEQICLTRQEIADFTGLRVETVIRTLKRMETENKIEIRNRKLYY